MDFRFQVNLDDIIDLLSHHLYSSPQVYIRELLQNGVDAILSWRPLEPEHRGKNSSTRETATNITRRKSPRRSRS